MYTEEHKKQVYQKWIENGRHWFDIDKSKEPTYAERQIIIEMKKREAGIRDEKKEYKPKNEIKRFSELLNLDNY